MSYGVIHFKTPYNKNLYGCYNLKTTSLQNIFDELKNNYQLNDGSPLYFFEELNRDVNVDDYQKTPYA
jgi:hypothetical protein